ncbi:MAG TPA: helix-turn-helix domain-containing protein [Longimicrobium sp.]|nr:helix-turn-helix domain-containing protein [Longimicrobium sp.]
MASTRVPRQERGRRRIDAILDAAAALIGEVGTEAVTVQALAARAGASKGSMYHFFPDRESVFLALAERHVAALRARLADAREARAQAVAAGAADDAAEAFLRPVYEYVDEHPDLPRMLGEPATLQRLAAQRAALHSLVEDHAASVVRSRNPGLASGQVSLAAAAMVAVMSAMRGDRVVACAAAPDAARRETRRILRAYLQSYEAG